MRIFVAALLLAVLPLSASAQDESVTVETRAMEGVWKITGMSSNIYCRFARERRDLAAYCTAFGPEKGSVDADDAHMHIAFGSMALRAVIDGPMQSSTHFTGHVALKVLGFSRVQPQSLTGTKLTLSESDGDAGGKAGLLRRLLEEMRDGKPTESFVFRNQPLVMSAAPTTVILTPEILRPLGTTEAIVYLGPLFGGTGAANNGHVYDVEFSNGERICVINQRDDGALDRFLCI